MVAAGAAFGVKRLHAFGQLLKGAQVVVAARLIEQARGKVVDALLVEPPVVLGAAVLAQALDGVLAELVVGHHRAGKAEDRKGGVEQVLAGQVKDGRQQLAHGEIAGGAKDDEQTGWGGAFHQVIVHASSCAPHEFGARG